VIDDRAFVTLLRWRDWGRFSDLAIQSLPKQRRPQVIDRKHRRTGCVASHGRRMMVRAVKTFGTPEIEKRAQNVLVRLRPSHTPRLREARTFASRLFAQQLLDQR